MKKRILAYLDYIDKLLEQENADWEGEIKKHLTHITFFAHERHMHLIVMSLFALATLVSILYVNFTGSVIVLALTGALFVLLIPYVKHYYLLENSVQKMYIQYDAMMNRLTSSFKM